MKMTIYAYFRKLLKSTSVGLMLRLKLPRVLKFKLAGDNFVNSQWIFKILQLLKAK